ncbi:MAG TPA: cytochrome c oxidase assembly protein [Streptosporangiaceae bacterium]|jgi:cytochrome c oxidase assembly factor CtaG
MPHGLGRLRPLLLLAAAALCLVLVLPPVADYARHDAVAQALQFVVFAAAAPALLVLGWPARLIRASRSVAPVRQRLRVPPGLARRPAVRASAALLPSLALVILWRVPVVLAAVARDPALTVVEMVTLVAAGCALWAELAGPRGARDALSRPLRAAMAAVEMWSIWAIAYITGMSTTGLARAQVAVPDHQLAVGVMWAVPAVCYVPVVFATMMSWLGAHEEQPADGLLADPAWPDAASRLHPPRGWR